MGSPGQGRRQATGAGVLLEMVCEDAGISGTAIGCGQDWANSKRSGCSASQHARMGDAPTARHSLAPGSTSLLRAGNRLTTGPREEEDEWATHGERVTSTVAASKA